MARFITKLNLALLLGHSILCMEVPTGLMVPMKQVKTHTHVVQRTFFFLFR